MSWQSDSMITKDGAHIAFGDWGRDDKTLRIDSGQASLVIQLTDDDLRRLIVMLGGRP